MKLSKNSFYKSWAPKLIFSYEIFFRKILIIFDIEKWLWKSEFCNLVGLITSTKNVQKKFQSHFCDQWSISFSLKSFYQIPLTWSKYWQGGYRWIIMLEKCRHTDLNEFHLNLIIGTHCKWKNQNPVGRFGANS